MKEKIIFITLGIRYKRSFRIPETSGEIMDEILYNDSSPFFDQYFKILRNDGRNEKMVENDSGEYLRINTDDLIIRIAVKNNFDYKIKELKEKIIPFLEKNIFDKFSIRNIARFGVIYSYQIDNKINLNKAIGVLSSGAIESPDATSVSFSKKLATSDSVKKDINDYINTIYNLNQSNKDYFAELDYQYYYDPTCDTFTECDLPSKLDNSLKFAENNFHIWLSSICNNEKK